MSLDYISGDTEVVHDDLNTINDNLIYHSISYIAYIYQKGYVCRRQWLQRHSKHNVS